MQESEEKNAEQRRSIDSRLLAIGLTGLLALVCLALVALAIAVSLPAVQLPTRMPTVGLEEFDPAVTAQASQVEDGDPAAIVIEPALVPQGGGRTAGDPYIPELGNGGYDVQRYTIRLAIDPAFPTIEGATTIDALSTLHGLDQLSLDFVGFEISSVTVDGLLVDFNREGKKLIVDLPAALPAGSAFNLVISYHGSPLEEPSSYLLFVDHLGLHFPDGETVFAIAEPDGARYWFPANDHPRDKATFRFELVAPAGMTAVANGQLLSREVSAMPDGQIGELFVWEHNFPMAPYLAVVAVGRYERVPVASSSGVPLRNYVFPELKAEVLEATGEIDEAVSWMSELFGPYPFENFGFVTARVPGGSMETQTMVLLSDGMIGPRTAVHELAHMWFGNWVSLDSWGEMWRNEGFATYVQLMWQTRDDPEELELMMAGVQSRVEENNKHYTLRNPPPQYLFEFDVYFEGAMVVHALRQEVGDEAFFGGLRTYFERYGGGTASDAQFQAVMEEAAGFSLAPFFEQWFPAE
jgi:aminopeptidase N